MNTFRRIVAAIVTASVLAGCGGQSTPTATMASHPTETITAESPTPNPAANTPEPTPRASQIASAENTPLPTIDASLANLALPPAILLYLNDVAITRFESFDQTRNPEEMFSGNAAQLDGTLTYTPEQNPPDPGLPIRQQLAAGQGVLFVVKFESGARAVLTLRHARTSQPEGARLGLSIARNTVSFYAELGGQEYEDQLVGNLNIFPDHWYYVLLAVGEDGKGIALVWDFENPNNAARTTYLFNPAGESWSLIVDVNRGVVFFDNYAEIDFSTVK